MEIILQGFLLGLLLSTSFGATFFLLIETSIKRGFRDANMLNIGAILSDVMYVLLAIYFSNEILSSVIKSNIFKIIACIVFILFGLHYIFLKKAVHRSEVSQDRFKNGKLFLTGFIINTLNPLVPLYWVIPVAFIAAEFNYSSHQLLIYFGTTTATVTGLNMLKMYFATFFQRFFNTKRTLIMNKIIGLIMIGFGIFFLIAGKFD